MHLCNFYAKKANNFRFISSINLRIEAIDGDNPALIAATTVKVTVTIGRVPKPNDNTPRFGQGFYERTIKENAKRGDSYQLNYYVSTIKSLQVPAWSRLMQPTLTAELTGL